MMEVSPNTISFIEHTTSAGDDRADLVSIIRDIDIAKTSLKQYATRNVTRAFSENVDDQITALDEVRSSVKAELKRVDETIAEEAAAEERRAHGGRWG